MHQCNLKFQTKNSVEHSSYCSCHFGFRYSWTIHYYTVTIVFWGAMSIVALRSRKNHQQHPVNCSCNGKASHYQLIYLEKRMVFTIWPDACWHFLAMELRDIYTRPVDRYHLICLCHLDPSQKTANLLIRLSSIQLRQLGPLQYLSLVCLSVYIWRINAIYYETKVEKQSALNHSRAKA